MKQQLNRPTTDNIGELLQTLKDNVRRIERAREPADERRLSTGCAALDRVLPGGGFGPGTLVEWLSPGPGCGVGTLALLAARELWAGPALAPQEGVIVVLDRRQVFYPPAAAALGINLERMIVIRARSERDEQWAWDQALRCPAVAAVWGEVERLDDRSFRRWQLAAEAGGGVGLLLRSTRVRGRPSWADVQLVVEALPSQGNRRWRLEVTRSRGSRSGGVVELEIDENTGALRPVSHSDETHPVPVVAELARAATGRRPARA